MNRDYTKERIFITNILKNAFDAFFFKTDKCKIEKSEFDIVTPLDLTIENYVIENIMSTYPNDMILSEENLNSTDVFERTWTIDPIDGTFNMANNSPLFGIQCSLIVNEEPVVSVIYLPLLNEVYYAQLGCGAFLNGKRICVNKDANLESSCVSFGDYRHKCFEEATLQHQIIGNLMTKIAKIRMFGAASIDFSYLASARTMGTVIFTKNKWDIVPGILLCKEAGALIKGSVGDYNWDSNFVIATANEAIYNEILSSMKKIII